MSRPRKIIRRVDFALEGMVNGTSGLDDSLDAIAKDVEEAILADPTCNALAKDTVLTGTEIDYNASGEQPVGSVKMTFQVTYRTTETESESPA
jgi:hypothetical protein